MRSDGSSTARYRAWMSRRRLTLRDRDRLTADIDRGRRSRVWPAIAVVSLGLVGRAVFAPGGSRRGLQNYAGKRVRPCSRAVSRPASFHTATSLIPRSSRRDTCLGAGDTRC